MTWDFTSPRCLHEAIERNSFAWKVLDIMLRYEFLSAYQIETGIFDYPEAGCDPFQPGRFASEGQRNVSGWLEVGVIGALIRNDIL